MSFTYNIFENQDGIVVDLYTNLYWNKVRFTQATNFKSQSKASF